MGKREVCQMGGEGGRVCQMGGEGGRVCQIGRGRRLPKYMYNVCTVVDACIFLMNAHLTLSTGSLMTLLFPIPFTGGLCALLA